MEIPKGFWEKMVKSHTILKRKMSAIASILAVPTFIDFEESYDHFDFYSAINEGKNFWKY